MNKTAEFAICFLNSNRKMKAAISGGSGFIGSEVSKMLLEMGYETVLLSRNDLYGPPAALCKKLSGTSLVIHLAGAPIIGRWTPKYQQEIYNSRIETTRNLVNAMRSAIRKPSVFICASAVGIYPSQGVFTEFDQISADTFLGEVCRDWEAQASKAPSETRVLNFRFGIVLGRNGGALPKLTLPFRFFAGGRIASGQQMISWIHIHDLINIFRFVIGNPIIKGPVNITSPQVVTNAGLAKTLAKVLNRPAVFPIPAFVLNLAFGKGARTLTDGQAAIPKKLIDAGFCFRYPNLGEALENLLK